MTMILLTSTFLLFGIHLVRASEVCCPEIPGLCFSTAPPFDHLPDPECPDDIEISMRVYTRTNRDNGQAITRTTIPPAWENSRRTHVIVHGWLGDQDNRWMEQMKNRILDRADYNVIITGWQESSQQIWYPRSASDTRSVGAHIAAVLENLIRNAGGDPDTFYCTGHSLGSHVCGHSGAHLQSLFGYTMGRITGLDPAGPLFEFHDPAVGLNENCASFVDALHTHGEPNIILNLGLMRRVAHVDFYPNGGVQQPGCILDPFRQKEGSDLLPACSHVRAVNFYHESINSPCFNSRESCTDQYNLPGSCTNHGTVVQTMGFEADDPSHMPEGIFYLETGDDSPYCLG